MSGSGQPRARPQKKPMEASVALAGLSALAGPIVAVACSGDQICCVHRGVRAIDTSNTFRLALELRSAAVQALWDALSPPQRQAISYVLSDGLVAFASPWPVRFQPDPPQQASQRAEAERQRLTADYAMRFPGWGFEQHFGADTAEHRQRLHDACRARPPQITPVHRRSFAPLCRWWPHTGRCPTLTHADQGSIGRLKKRS